MPSPRICRLCGKALLPDLRWCPQCYEPVVEFAARAPLHHGDFVGPPIHERGHVPHWSRWEKSATTFGPWGRLVATAVLFLTLMPAAAWGGVIYLVTFPFFAALVLRGIWAKGWVVYDEPEVPTLPVVVTPRAPEPLTGPMQAFRIARWSLGLTAILLFAYGPVPAKAIVMGLAAIVLPWWFFRGVMDR
jgi:hypothetical protein